MNTKDEDLIQVIHRAHSLYERIGASAPSSITVDALVHDRLKRWCDRVSIGDWRLFNARLLIDDLTLEKAQDILNWKLPHNLALPDWTKALLDTLQSSELTSCGPDTSDRAWKDEEEMLGAVLHPIISFGRRRLGLQVGSSHLLSETALEDLVISFGRELNWLCKKAIQYEWRRFNIPSSTLTDKMRMNGFLLYMANGGLKQMLLKFPVLARLVGDALFFWLINTEQLLVRLSRDYYELASMLHHDDSLGVIVNVSPKLSDFHLGHQAVKLISFSSGAKVIYKPRDMGIEDDFNRLVDWLNEKGAPVQLRSIRILNHGEYGWAEFVNTSSRSGLHNSDSLLQYGALLCLAYVLRATDCHYENVIKSEAGPVLVDAETLMNSVSPSKGELSNLFADTPVHTVLNTGILPTWSSGRDGQLYDTSALGNDLETLRDSSTARFATCVGSIIAGFEQTYRFIVEQREILMASKPFVSLTQQTVRFVLRPTRVYLVLLEHLLEPAFLIDGIDRSIEIDALSRAFSPFGEEERRNISFLREEHRSLYQSDIPYFTCRAARQSSTPSNKRTLHVCYERSTSDLVLKRLSMMDEVDLAHQLVLIHGSIHASRVRHAVVTNALISNVEQVAVISKEELVHEANAIADELIEYSLRDHNGLSWVSMAYRFQHGHYSYEPMKGDLYSGIAGPALFLSAIGSITGNSQWKMYARAAVEPFIQVLRDEGYAQRLRTLYSIGGADGLGSMAYVLSLVGRFLSDEALFETAICIGHLITSEKIATDSRLDVISGAAGATLSLLASYEMTGDEILLDRAILCGQHLLRTRVVGTKGPRAWLTSAETPLTGFSHGAAGIAYSLLRLYSYTNMSEFLDAADEAIAYESSVFSAECNNWPDFRGKDGEAMGSAQRFGHSWCHGAPGIGLARIGTYSVLPVSHILRDIQLAAQTTFQFGLTPVDHLCCGNAGRIELLLTAGRQLGREDLSAAANSWAASLVRRKQQEGSYRLFQEVPHLFNPGFFQGTSGIGYELLRLARTGELPSVLLWGT